jgi:2-oxoglutarate dehydrogenase E2 component (dihydrolipoamide succinyltransferase)
MAIEVKVPQLPESVADAVVVAWHKAAGDSVRRDENLVDLETDKVVLEVPAPDSGVLAEIRIANGTTVTSGQVLAVLEPGEVAVEPAAAAVKAEATAPSAAVESGTGDDDAAGEAGSAHKLSPAVRRITEEHDLDPSLIKGSGKDGRLTKGDVLEYLDERRASNAGLDYEAPADTSGGDSRTEQRVPMTRLRARIAERLVEAQQTAAMLTTFNEVDLTEVMALRKRYKESFQTKHGAKLGFMSFFVKASVEALKRFPAVNASIEGSDVLYHDYFDIGIAVSSDRGLLVPILRDADRLSFAGIETAINDLGERARAGKISVDELTGGTFTITNGGIFGSMLSTPILNPPQSGILGMHKIDQRPVAVDGEVQIRPMMYLALTYDHRIIDGSEAVRFLVTIREQLEDPARLLLSV